MNIDGNMLRVLSSTGIRREQSELLTLKVYDELPTLCMAAEAGDTSMVQQLLAAGADATRGLPAAVARGDTALVSMLLAAGANVQNVLSGGDRRLMDLLVTQADGVPTRPVAMEAWLQGGGEGVVRSLLAARAEPTPALFPAAEGDEFEVVRMLLASVPDGEDTGIELATEHGEGLVRMLLEAGADVASSDGFGLLEAAASAGDAEAVQLLLDGGASGSGADMLAAAMQAGAPDVVRKLLDAGAVPGEPDGLVLFAVQEGDAELLQRLLSDLPVDVDAQDARGMSALHHAADGGELEICELLLDAGAHCDRSRLGYCPTPRQFAKSGGHDECVELLRNAEGVDDASDYDSDSKSDSEEDESLEAAASAGDAEAVQLLLDGGASGSGADMLAAAMQAGAPDVVRKLLDAGAVPGEPDGLVLFAVQEGDAELLQRLLSDLPVDVDAQDARGMSALHHAADGGELEICELLLDAGAHCDRSRLGYCPTPRQFAKSGGHDECVELLRNAEGVDDASDYDSDSKSDSEEDESGGRCAPSFAASCEGDTTGKKLKLRDKVVIFGLEAASARPLLASRPAHGHGLCLYLQGHALRWHAIPPVRARLPLCARPLGAHGAPPPLASPERSVGGVEATGDAAWPALASSAPPLLMGDRP